MKVLVTGGVGYLGAVLIQRMVDAGYAVRCLDGPDRHFPAVLLHCARGPAAVEMVVGDVRDCGLLQQLCGDIDAVIHLAGIVGYPACDAEPARAVSVNVDGTRCITDAIRPGTPLVHVSTCSVYGKTIADTLRETATAEPLTLYGRTKLAAEQLATSVGGINLRLTTVYGPSPRMRLDLLIHNFCKIALTHGKLALFDPAALRPFVHIEDAVASMIFALENWGTMSGSIYNVGSDASTVSKLELVRMIDRLVPLNFVIDETQADPENRQSHVCFDSIEACGFSTRHPLASGLADTIDAVRHLLAEEGRPA
jgi:nucleoside-diphosphate-sugar epimerase